MASLYKEADWSTNLGTVKNNIVQRLANGKVNWLDKYHKLKKYLEHDNFSLTDVWAVLLVSYLVKEVRMVYNLSLQSYFHQIHTNLQTQFKEIV